MPERPTHTASLRSCWRCGTAVADRPELTAEQHQLLQLIADGKTNLEIGAQLFLSDSTVKVHLRKLAKALQARGRANTVARAFRLGLMPPDPEEANRD